MPRRPLRYVADPVTLAGKLCLCASKRHAPEQVPNSARFFAMVIIMHSEYRMIHGPERNPATTGQGPEAAFRHRSSVLLTIVCLLSGLLALFVFSAVFGPSFDSDSHDLILAYLLGGLLLTVLAPFVWLLWQKPVVLIVSNAGIHLPFAFKRPLRWDEIHRIRLLPHGKSLFGRRDWMIIDPSPGVLAPIRLKTWRRLDLWFQKHHGVRIPLHGLNANPDEVVRAIEVYRPVVSEEE